MKYKPGCYTIITALAIGILVSVHAWWNFSGGQSLAATVFQSVSMTCPGPAPACPAPAPAPVISPPVEYRQNSSSYNFINPLFFIETSQRLYPEFDSLNLALSRYIRSATTTGQAASVSVYVRDMNDGHWMGINDQEKYEPSSMLKVAVMMAYFQKAITDASESDVSFDDEMNNELYYPGPDETGQYYTASSHLAPGYYPVQTLIDDMIVNSDNSALNVLLAQDEDQYEQIYKDFRLPTDTSLYPEDFMTARSYSVLFRTLYNGTYLPWNVSEQALKLLASTTFTDGLVAGVPVGTVVSHKFGEHTYVNPDGTPIYRELHDCGIIYYPLRPYFVCVMTKGKDFPTLAKIIASISQQVRGYMAASTSTPAL